MQESASVGLDQIGLWKRIFYMLIYGLLAGLVRMSIWVVILFQVSTLLFTGQVNQYLLDFGRSLSTYLFHLLLFLTFNTDDLAFPFASWRLNKETGRPKPRSAG